MHSTIALVRFICLITPVAPTALPASTSPEKVLQSQYYTIHHDLDDAIAREAAIRLDKVFEEYRKRTTAFGGKIMTRLPVYLFSSHEDYVAAGAVPGSAGVFMYDKLMAVVGKKATPFTWKLLQHEGFHQFVHAVIGGNIPTWVNEGMAEYFEEAVFTGDTMLSGAVPQTRLVRVRKALQTGAFRPLEELMLITTETWNKEISWINYDQAWSMVHFLAHGENGKYTKYFDAFLRDVGVKGLDWKMAWTRNFGQGTGEFETAWKLYWLGLPDNPTAMLYAEATVRTLTGCLGRSHTQRQNFSSCNEFFEMAGEGKLLTDSADWLPPRLVDNALKKARKMGKWKLLTPRRKNPQLRCTLRNGRTLVGSFTANGARIGQVTVSAQ